ncbi:hypothetical protein R3P38DRAFT_2901163 [Favolaschia claudopus]|uniref:Uncharacterized protein n=1 Tax=Favolaschia claudopus TaxID=2862362 RepID=A0AAW0CMH4_9AGAR
MDFGGYVERLNSDYVRPARVYLERSYETNPTATMVAAIFVATSLIPVVSTISLVFFASYLAVVGLFTTILALVLSLLVALSATFLFSLSTTFLISRRSQLYPESARTGAAAAQSGSSEGIPRTFSRGFSLRRPFSALRRSFRSKKGANWPLLLIVFLLLRNPLARIFLPRAVRYHKAYPLIFGSDRTPHPFKWTILWFLSPVIAVAQIVFKVLSIGSVLGLEGIVLAGVIFVLVSKRGGEARKGVGAAVAPFLRDALRGLEDLFAEPHSTESTSGAPSSGPPAADTTGVPSVVSSGQEAGSTGVSMTDAAAELRARSVPGAMA